MTKMRPTHDPRPRRYDSELGRYVLEPRTPENVRLDNMVRYHKRQAQHHQGKAAMHIALASDNEQQADIYREALVKWETDERRAG